MSTAKQMGKTHNERFVEIEEQMLYQVEVLDSISSLETQLNEISKKADAIDVVSGRLDRLPIRDLLARVDTLESRVMRIGNVTYERREISSSSTA